MGRKSAALLGATAALAASASASAPHTAPDCSGRAASCQHQALRYNNNYAPSRSNANNNDNAIDQADDDCSSATTSWAALLSTIRGGTSHGSSSSSSNNEPSANLPKTPNKESKTRNRRTSSSKDKSRAPSKGTTAPKKSSSPVVNEILKEEDYYKILGTTKEHVQKSAKPDTVIQKAYRRRALQTHPDKTGGDRRAFDKVAEAYDVLQDGEKRKLYDRYGKQGVAASGGAGAGMSGMGAEEIFRSFFGGGSGTGSPFASFGQQHYQQQQRNRSMRFELDVSLEDLYRGKSMNVLLPGNKKVHVTIPRGAFDNQQIVASGAMDSDANQPPGDAHFALKQRPHATFTRKGHDLAVQLEISLSEAIAGVARKIRHLDGRTLHVVSAAGDVGKAGPAVIATGDVHVLKGEGMPKDALGTEFGDLYIQYHVNLPTKFDHCALTEAERHELKRLLNKLEGKTTDTTSDWPFEKTKGTKVLQKASSSDFGRSGGHHQPSFDGFEDPGFSPFGDRRLYWSSSTSSNPFFGQPGFGNEDDGETQCRQM